MNPLTATILEQCFNYRLTCREKEVISHAFSGKTDKEIAHALGNSPRTVHHQLQSAYRKLGVRTRMEGIHKLLQAAGQIPQNSPILLVGGSPSRTMRPFLK